MIVKKPGHPGLIPHAIREFPLVVVGVDGQMTATP
jgi:hypothetical protein